MIKHEKQLKNYNNYNKINKNNKVKVTSLKTSLHK